MFEFLCDHYYFFLIIIKRICWSDKKEETNCSLNKPAPTATWKSCMTVFLRTIYIFIVEQRTNYF
jgi:hypothetical protein